MVLMLLAVIWIAVLAPPLLRRGVETRRSDSVGDFRRHLGVLQRTGPSTIAPAHTRLARSSSAYGAAVVSATRAGRSPARGTVAARRQTLRRRRNVFLGLVGSTVVFVAAGAVPGLHMLWGLAAVCALMLGAYVAMLIHLRNMAAERDMKLTFLSSAVAPQMASLDPAAMLLRRSAAN